MLKLFSPGLLLHEATRRGAGDVFSLPHALLSRPVHHFHGGEGRVRETREVFGRVIPKAWLINVILLVDISKIVKYGYQL